MADILLVNDDGYLSPGLTALADALSPLCASNGKLTVVAPHRQTSWIGKASSYRKELKFRNRRAAEREIFTLEGSPADCTQAGIYHLCGEKPDLVVSGINIGANVGDSYIYSSGTVGGALEAVLAGIPGLAVGIEIPYDTLTHLEFNQDPNETGVFEEAAALSARFAGLLLREENLPPLLYNLNFPGGSDACGARRDRQTKIRLARPARYDYGPFLEANGKGFHHKGVRKDYSQAEAGTDMHAIAEGYASLSILPLYGALETAGPAVLKALGRILEELNSGAGDG